MMKNKLLPLLAYSFLLVNCENKAQNKSVQNKNITVAIATGKINNSEIKEILNTETTRYEAVSEGYKFYLPFNFSIWLNSIETTPNNYFKFVWKLRDNFTIDSKSPGFKRFALNNFIPFMPFSKDSGELFIFKDNGISDLKIEDFLRNYPKVFYKDENSAIVKIDGRIKTICFHHLPESKEYALYMSDSPFWNIRPEISENQEVNQLSHQLRLAKNIFKPIVPQDKNWKNYKTQLSKMETDFFEKINSEVVKAFQNDPKLKSYFPADQGNNSYYSVFKTNEETDKIWKKMQSTPENGVMKVGEKDFEYLRNENFSFFYPSDYQLISKSEKSFVFKRESSGSFCLVSKSKSGKFLILKEFPELQFPKENYYNEEIDFYKAMFDNSL